MGPRPDVSVRRFLARVRPIRESDGGTPMRRLWAIITVIGVVTGMVAAEAVTATAAKTAVPGVTSSVIKVGGLASPPNDTLNVSYPDGFDGAQAYFDLINKKGGVFGRKIQIVAKLSDQGQPST